MSSGFRMRDRALGLRTAMRHVLWVLRAERGAAGVEYGVLIAAIAAVIIAIVYALGLKVEGLFQSANKGW